MTDRAITDDGDFCAGTESMPEWQSYLLYVERTKAETREEPMSFEAWRDWKRWMEKQEEQKCQSVL